MKHTMNKSWEWDRVEEERRDAHEEERKLYCKKGYEVKALQSGAGWYLGTFLNGEGGEYGPNCRISRGYASSKEEAEALLKCDRQDAEENCFCNGGSGCFCHKKQKEDLSSICGLEYRDRWKDGTIEQYYNKYCSKCTYMYEICMYGEE